MKFFRIKPEIPVRPGEAHVKESPVRPIVAERPIVEFGLVPRSAIFYLNGCVLVTQELRRALEEGGVTGCQFRDVEVTVDPDYFTRIYLEEFMAGKTLADLLPTTYAMQVDGIAGSDDAGVFNDELVISWKFLELLFRFGMEWCIIEPFELPRGTAFED